MAFPDGAVLVARALLCVFLEWLENELYSEEQHVLADQKNFLHEDKVNDVTADHSATPQEKKQMKLVRSILSWDGTTSSFTKCWLSIAKERRLP